MKDTAIKLKFWVLRHYLWISFAFLAAGVVFIFALFCIHDNDAVHLTLVILAIPGAVFYALQKQKTEELELFSKLFNDFNNRYKGMNRGLQDILSACEDKPFEKDEKYLLFTYFNLCAEEYLFYRQGYIYPEVWQAWHNGMRVYLRNRRIRRLWDEDSGRRILLWTKFLVSKQI